MHAVAVESEPAPVDALEQTALGWRRPLLVERGEDVLAYVATNLGPVALAAGGLHGFADGPAERVVLGVAERGDADDLPRVAFVGEDLLDGLGLMPEGLDPHQFGGGAHAGDDRASVGRGDLAAFRCRLRFLKIFFVGSSTMM